MMCAEGLLVGWMWHINWKLNISVGINGNQTLAGKKCLKTGSHQLAYRTEIKQN